jgi:dihydrofolate synthase/folylpolyglutamate synthase
MFYYFAREQVDFAVVEVGLGGRLDSTNVMNAFSKEGLGGVMVSVITSVSYDHTQILGNTLEKIAFEKAGIIKEGIPVILYPQKKEVEQVIEKVCIEKRCRLIKVSELSAEYMESPKICKNSVSYAQRVKIKTNENMYDIQLSLLGKHQILNCATAVLAIEELIKQRVNVKHDNIIKALAGVKWIGRLEVIKNKPLVVIDGAHNIEGISKLKENVEQHFKYDKMVLILGILADKEVEKMVSTIVPLADRVIAVTPNSCRAENAVELRNVIQRYNDQCDAIESYKEAYQLALSYCKEDDILLISGSLYMIGDMRKIIRSIYNE